MQIVALANLHPADKGRSENCVRIIRNDDEYLADELDSFMYQTVGHQGIEMLAEAMELPLYRRTTSGLSNQTGKNYEPTAEDEVEDLYELLKQVKVRLKCVEPRE